MSQSTSYLKYLKYKAKYMQLKLELEGAGYNSLEELYTKYIDNQKNAVWSKQRLTALLNESTPLKKYTTGTWASYPISDVDVKKAVATKEKFVALMNNFV